MYWRCKCCWTHFLKFDFKLFSWINLKLKLKKKLSLKLKNVNLLKQTDWIDRYIYKIYTIAGKTQTIEYALIVILILHSVHKMWEPINNVSINNDRINPMLQRKIKELDYTLYTCVWSCCIFRCTDLMLKEHIARVMTVCTFDSMQLVYLVYTCSLSE